MEGNGEDARNAAARRATTNGAPSTHFPQQPRDFAVRWLVILLGALLTAALAVSPVASSDADLIGWHGETHHVSSASSKDAAAAADPPPPAAILSFDFVMNSKRKPKPSHHASTIVEGRPGELVVAWFAGRFEGKPDVGIYVSRRAAHDGAEWTDAELVAEPQPSGPCWNPGTSATIRLHRRDATRTKMQSWAPN